MIGFIFGAYHSFNDLKVVAKSVSRPLLPAKRRREIIVPGRNGSYNFSEEDYENRPITVELQYVGNSFIDLRSHARKIAKWLSQEEYSLLTFDDETDKYYLAKVYEEVDLKLVEKLVSFGSATVTFNCQPFAFGGKESSRFVNDTNTVVNFGSVKTSPRFISKFIGDCSEWTVTKLKPARRDRGFLMAEFPTEFNEPYSYTDKHIKITNNFVQGDVLEVNCITGAIYLNKVRAMDLLVWENSHLDDFFMLPGDTTFVITPTNKCTTDIYWIPQFL